MTAAPATRRPASIAAKARRAGSLLAGRLPGRRVAPCLSRPLPGRRFPGRLLGCLVVAMLAGCAADEVVRTPDPATVRARLVKLLPPGTPDAAGWAADIQTSFSLLGLEPTVDALCASIAVIAQESSFRADPAVPNLPAIAWKEIDDRAADLGVPSLIVRTAMKLSSSDGRSYAERIDAARTERDLSETFEDLIGRVPLGKRLFGDLNPVRTGGPMQVSIAWAQRYNDEERRYPYADAASIRSEIFTRRGGLYFGIAHLLDYPAGYDRMLYRFADFNAGHYASRNAAFQSAVASLTATKLALDGDLVAPGGADKPGSTETAVRRLGPRLGLDDAAIRRDLERENTAAFEQTRLWRSVFDLADRNGKASGKGPAPRAVLPQIRLVGPKISRNLTTAWFAERVDGRRAQCVARDPRKSATAGL